MSSTPAVDRQWTRNPIGPQDQNHASNTRRRKAQDRYPMIPKANHTRVEKRENCRKSRTNYRTSSTNSSMIIVYITVTVSPFKYLLVTVPSTGYHGWAPRKPTRSRKETWTGTKTMSLWLAFDLERTASMRETPIEGLTPLFSSRRDGSFLFGPLWKKIRCVDFNCVKICHVGWPIGWLTVNNGIETWHFFASFRILICGAELVS